MIENSGLHFKCGKTEEANCPEDRVDGGALQFVLELHVGCGTALHLVGWVCETYEVDMLVIDTTS